ncbi:PAS domain-containing hybrid sensor histidine kinase/response regulator [Albibacterium bauzanense]|uniref:Sensory/regulatory protein RpfC n=1 Tax=Albibacterium bauzanense TaxID=653929 RepID=A0A4V2PY93_9SPHI|nr:PAS domain-containing hybrid sensor histidine kinase/response regulator [Albibacterium bauzanense]TCK85121.1 PAS domain S-box-containing protein [Albibacterium bauzanense]
MKKKHLLKALRKYSQLNVKIKNENIFDLLNESVALIADVPLSNICLFQGDEMDFIANYGLKFNLNSLSQLPYRDLIVHNNFFEIKDIEASNYHNLTGFNENKICFFATHPFYDSEGSLLGTINLYDYKKRKLNVEQKQYILKAANRASQITIDRKTVQASQLLEILFESTDDLIVVSNREKILHINPAASKLLGYSQVEILKSELTRYFHPDDVQSFEEAVKLHSKGRVLKKLTNRLISKCGKTHYIQWASVLEEETRLIYSIGRDITNLEEQKNLLSQSEKRFRAFFENSQNLFCMHNLEGNFLSVNKTGADMVGYTIEEIKQISLFDIIPENNQVLLKQYLNTIKTKGRAEGIMKVITKTGNIRTWLFNNVLQQDDQEKEYVIGSAVDLTERFELEGQLKDAKRNAIQASSAKSEFLANMSHEIRTPLNGIIGFTDLMLKTKLDNTQQQYVNIINQSGSTLLGIINDILDFSKIEAGKLILNNEKVDLQDMASQTCSIVTYGVEQKKVELLLDISENAPRYIWADETRLKQILVNLLSNAIKFTEEGEVELKITPMQEFSDGKTSIRFEVRDTGIGIKKEKQKEIFEAFAQEDGSITKKYGGTGLGLTISNSLLKLADSKLHLISDVGMGSCFYFDLTFKTEKDEPEDVSLKDVKSVLVVDDNANNRRILKHMLELKKITVNDVDSGSQALRELQSGKNYDVIIMDYHMPFMDGIETIRKIKSIIHAQKQPIIMLYSSSDDDQLQEACDELGVESRLVKPIKMREMYQVLAQLKKENLARKSIKQEDRLKFAKGIKVLIAEDNEVNMFLTKSIIQQIAPDASIFEARDGKQAVKQYQKEDPDIILMDVQMPNLNGIEATHTIRELQKSFHVPIIALTAGAMNDERERCLEAGMDDFMTKPIVKQDIADMFTKWIGTATAQETSSIYESPINFQLSNHIDRVWFDEYTSLDPTFKIEFIKLLKLELCESGKYLKQHVDSNDLEGLKRTGHKLKGTSLTAGLTELSKLAIAFELLADFDATYIEELLEKTLDEIKIILNLLELE